MDNDNKSNKKPPILRIADIIPPFHNELIEESKKMRMGSGQQNNQDSVNRESSSEGNSEIPKFDVAGQILAEQRKNTATKRVSPAGHKTAGSTVVKKEQNSDKVPQTKGNQEIIAIKEIVKIDIEKFCRNKLSK